MLTEIQAQIERVTYYDEENGFMIAKARMAGRHDLVTIVGHLLSVTAGEALKLKGEWRKHPRFGEQFRIESYESIVPATVAGIERYLGSGLIKGIGPIMAKRLVSKFGSQTLQIIETSIERLRSVEGIGDKRIELIKKAWDEQRDIRDVMLFLQGHGVTPAYGAKIFKQYGKDSIQVVKNNPYRLATDIFGIGFLTADKIAEKMHIPRQSPMRVEAGILYVLRELSEDGHVCYPSEPLIEECMKVLCVEKDAVITGLSRLASEGKIIVENADSGYEPAVADGLVSLTKFHASEVGISQRLRKLIVSPRMITSFDGERALEWVQGELRIRLAGKQQEAVKQALANKVMVVTGGPGTGKTTVINAVISICRKLGQRVLLAAPTGRAAKRMTESTGHDAKTIHRLLEYSPRETGFKRDGNNPLDADLIIIDEASMVDSLLMHHFVTAVPDHAGVILVGDVDQLPSVGAGNVLRDIIDSGIVPTVRLTEIFRQAKESLIVVNAHRINRGEMPLIMQDGGLLHDFYFFPVEEPEKVREKILDLCKEKIPVKFGYHPIDDIQVLTPMHRGSVGASHLNAGLQECLNPSSDRLVRGGKVFKPGDKVMQVRNNYDKDVFNGDVGRIAHIDAENQEVTVNYDGRPVIYDYAELDEIVVAYAVSIHKSQGSEYPVVVMPVHTQHYMLLQRNLLYTGITRAKKLVVLVGTMKAIAIATRNNRPQQRYTLLKERLLSVSAGKEG